MAGTKNNPVKWDKFVTGANIIPGDPLHLVSPLYNGKDMYLLGTAERHITIRPENLKSIMVDGAMTLFCEYVDFYDIDFTDSNPDRTMITNSILANSGTCSFYGCIFSDEHTSGLNWYGSGAGEVAESIFLNNGNIFPDGSKHGHGLYAHNDGGGVRLIGRNIFCTDMGDYGLHIYANSSRLFDFTVEDNINLLQATHTGGQHGLKNFVYRRNIHYLQMCNNGRYASLSQNENGEISDNIHFLPTALSVCAGGSYNHEWLNLTESNNQIYGGVPCYYAGTETLRDGWTYTAEPPQTWTRVIPFSKSARWVGSVAIFNRDGLATVSVDFTGIPNGEYLLRNAQNPAETWAFSIDGNPVDVPMENWTAAQRIGHATPPHTFPQFGAFVVQVV